MLSLADARTAYLFALWPQADREWPRALGALPSADGTLSRRELTRAWWHSPCNPMGATGPVSARARTDNDIRAAIDVLTDLGVWGREGDTLTGTGWGRDLVSVLEPMVDLPDPFAGGTVEIELPEPHGLSV